jgi:hypothetical protein
MHEERLDFARWIDPERTSPPDFEDFEDLVPQPLRPLPDEFHKALALAERSAQRTAGQRYRVAKVDGEWKVSRTDARRRLGERPPHQLNEFGTDMDEVRTNKVVTFDNGQRGLVVRMDTQRWGVIELYDKDGELSGEKALFHAANVWIVQ